MNYSEEEIEAKNAYDRAAYGVNRPELLAMGERAVRDALNSGKYGYRGLAPFDFVSACLADMEFVRTSEAAASRDAREELTLSIAKESNSIASDALASARTSARWAMWAAIITVIAAAIAVKDQMLLLIFGHT